MDSTVGAKIRRAIHRHFGQPGRFRSCHVQRVSKILEGDHWVVDLRLKKAAFSGFLEGSFEVKTSASSLFVVARNVLLNIKRMAGRS